MTKYPKEWINEVASWLNSEHLYGSNGLNGRAKKVLDALKDHGALKTLPKPMEWMICKHGHATAFNSENEKPAYCYGQILSAHKYKPCPEIDLVHVREVIDGD